MFNSSSPWGKTTPVAIPEDETTYSPSPSPSPSPRQSPSPSPRGFPSSISLASHKIVWNKVENERSDEENIVKISKNHKLFRLSYLLKRFVFFLVFLKRKISENVSLRIHSQESRKKFCNYVT